MLPNFTYVRASSVREAVKHLSSDSARLHAGGTDLLGCLRDHVFGANKLVSLSKIKPLRGIGRSADGGLRIGALTTIAEVAENLTVKALYPGLAQGALEVASPQLRNQGTIGGNLCQKPRCWYYRGEFRCLRKGGERCYAVGGENRFHCILGGDLCYIVHPSDTAPPLVALNASVRVVGQRGTRTVPVEHFHILPSQDPQRETVLEPDEIVTEILLSPPRPGLKSSYRKVRARRAWDFALAGVALAMVVRDGKVEHARVVFSGVAPVPWRAREVETYLTGKPLTEETAARAAEIAVQKAEPMEQNGYKVPLLKAVVEEQLMAIES
jgi:xanthine dehydrogenase YagS FAD-binding subunit